ncbi:cytochrome b/b6 domain-containing protein [Sedimentitalea nanhaiensis]|uniref:Cytochrome b n=1 Tax=Sedimentitalea nanhaiensis TaxID=999627 RepID=A0A1I6Z018_9RHOB|nr:cytochrome b/b6 domain-containing protein [Sedimentitalea nanhaiensis]SFT55771.1 Cytochrome b [Sedimentitalea nanhaiensis]
MRKIKVWDPFVRIFHWSLVILFGANALIVDDDGKLHIWIGYAVLGLVLLRMAWGVVGTRYARFSSFPPSLEAAKGQLMDIATGRRREHAGHTPLGAWMIYNLLIALLVICVSGYLMTTDMFWGKEWPEELHEFAVAWAEISVVLHIAAVVFESRRLGTNLPRAMVTGYKEVHSEQTSDP